MKDIEAFKAMGYPHRDFACTSEVDEKAYTRLAVQPLEDLLNQELRLQNYGSVSQIHFVPVAIQNARRHQSISYHPDTATVYIYIQLDYTYIEQSSSSEELLPVLARYFLTTISLFSEIPVPYFAISAFYRDVVSLFRDQGWAISQTPQLDTSPIYLVWASEFQSATSITHPAELFARKVTRHEWFDHLDLHPFLDRLHGRIRLGDYGSGVTSLYLSFLADTLEPDTSSPDSTYFREDRELHLSIPLGLPPFESSDLITGLIEALPEVAGWDIEDFAWRQMRKDLRKIIGSN